MTIHQPQKTTYGQHFSIHEEDRAVILKLICNFLQNEAIAQVVEIDNMIAEVLLPKYVLLISHKMFAHLTTNLNSEKLEGIYGNRIRSKMRKKFNSIVSSIYANDKRR